MRADEAVPVIRLRQGVVVARDVEPLAGDLRRELGLSAPFEDPGVGEFGIRNAVMALGDTFLEVIAPFEAAAPSRRRLDRGGPGGYMLIVQVDDVEAARRRAAALGVRVVWRADLPDISGTHLHPRDIGGTLLSVDEARPAATWRWGGPAWTGRSPDAPGRGGLTGATVAAADPDATASRWAQVLGCAGPEPATAGGIEIALAGGRVRFVPAGAAGEGITGFELAVDPAVRRGRDRLDLGGTRFDLADA